MSQEVYKYIETALEKKETLFQAEVINLNQTIDFLKNSGIQVVACTEKTKNLIYAQDYTIPTAIIMGSEEDGISEEYLKLCTHKTKIPMMGSIGSLNVSVSAGVILYEAVRQRKS